ncbi:MAG: SDR family oxidoreductase [Cyclobacteriaceae bacterium]|nr:SDR family oxidoreductase [Cyclobacteriaceae bacterium HetDA_MAG_MS6]
MKNWALVVGGSSGIGLAIAKKLAKHNFNLVLIHRDRRQQSEVFSAETKALESIGAEVITYNQDGTNTDKLKGIIEDLTSKIPAGSIRVMVHALSRGNLKPIVSDERGALTSGDYQLTMEAMGTNLNFWATHLHEQKLFSQPARIVALTSEGNKKYWSGYDAVAMAKAVLETSIKYLAVELAPHHIQTCCIQAGVTDTPSLRLIPGSDELLEASRQRNPGKRLTTPEDVADVVYLLSKDEANWINGSIIHVDGGEHLV